MSYTSLYETTGGVCVSGNDCLSCGAFCVPRDTCATLSPSMPNFIRWHPWQLRYFKRSWVLSNLEGAHCRCNHCHIPRIVIDACREADVPAKERGEDVMMPGQRATRFGRPPKSSSKCGRSGRVPSSSRAGVKSRPSTSTVHQLVTSSAERLTMTCWLVPRW